MADEQCAVCDSKMHLKRCVRCRSVLYCSKEHQIADWKTHKKQCHRPKSGLRDAKQAERDAFVDKTTTTSTLLPGAKRPVCDNALSSAHADDKVESVSGSLGTDFSNIQLMDKEREETETRAKCRIEKSAPELSPFDQRPLNLAESTETEGLFNDQISSTIFSALCHQGYCVLRGFIRTEICSKALDEATDLNSKGEMCLGRLAGGKSSSQESQKITESNIRSDKMTWIEGNETNVPGISEIVKTMDETVEKFNSQKDCPYIFCNRTKAMVACYPGNGSFYRRHVDNPNRDGRVLTCICYLNPNWDPEKDGGVLRLFPGGSDDYVDVVPETNTLLLFWSDRRSPHEVQPSFRTRYAVTAWFFDQSERTEAKIQACEDEQRAIRGEIAILDVRTKDLQKEKLRVQVETKAKSAIEALSQGEIEAILTLIDSHPAPGEVLSGLGIAPSIQAELMKLYDKQQSALGVLNSGEPNRQPAVNPLKS